MATTLTSKGQVTIPKPVRDALGVGPGQAVESTLQPDGEVVVTKAGGKNHIRPVRAFARPGHGRIHDRADPDVHARRGST